MRTRMAPGILLVAVSILPAVSSRGDARLTSECNSLSAAVSARAGAEAIGLTSITVDFKFLVAAVRDDSTVVLAPLETGSREIDRQHVVQLDDSVKIRARSKKDFQGRKKLGLADLREGQTVKVTLYVADGSIRSITVLEKA